jgi:hypothetical protein
VRPFEFDPGWANFYYACMMEVEKRILWHGIDIRSRVRGGNCVHEGRSTWCMVH